MGVLYKDNRLVPAIIITAALWFFFVLLDPVSFDRTIQHPPPVVQVVTESTRTQQQPHWQLESESPQIKPQPLPATTPSAQTHHESRPSSAPSHTQDGKLSPEDVLLIVKTGGTSMWKRLLAHLLTTLAPERIPLQNTVIYSDSADTIGAFTVIDILANTSAATLESPEFDIYRSQASYAAHNVYLEAAGVDGDDWGPQGGWIIDKYKFVPLVQHAGENWPAAKWYIYMEDDTYLFLPSVLTYLSGFDHREPHWLGSYAAKSDVVFAQGGAGFALSRGAWEASFGRNKAMAEEYEGYTADHCCGDQVLGHALNKYGVKLGENGGDEVFRYGFNPLVHWTFAFEKWSWCLPLYSWHKVHARDVARYYELERSWDYTTPFRHGDFFTHMIAPELKKRAEWWDNMSDKFRVTSANTANPPTPEGLEKTETWAAAWESVEACEAACMVWDACVQWSFAEDLCKMDDKAIMGKGYAPEMPQRKTALKTTSGWLKERIETWDSYCDIQDASKAR